MYINSFIDKFEEIQFNVERLATTIEKDINKINNRSSKWELSYDYHTFDTDCITIRFASYFRGEEDDSTELDIDIEDVYTNSSTEEKIKSLLKKAEDWEEEQKRKREDEAKRLQYNLEQKEKALLKGLKNKYEG